MTSHIIFTGIKHKITLSSSDITQTEKKSGRLQAGAIINKMAPGMKIDALVLKKEYPRANDESAEFNEDDIRERHTYTYSDLSSISFEKGRLAVGTAFFKVIEGGDIVELVLH
jgi:hypothetical protein